MRLEIHLFLKAFASFLEVLSADSSQPELLDERGKDWYGEKRIQITRILKKLLRYNIHTIKIIYFSIQTDVF